MGELERPVKILILGEASAIHSRRWVNHFRARGWTVRWLSFPPIPASVHAEAIPRRTPWKALDIPLSVRHVRTIIDSFTPDIVSALFLPDYGWLGALCHRRPLAVSAWGSDVLISPRKSAMHRRRITYVLQRADLLFTDARFLGDVMREYGAESQKIHVIPLGVDRSWLGVHNPREDKSSRVVRVLSNRRLEPLYRVETFLKAAVRLQGDSPNAYEFLVVGDGSQRQKLTRMAADLELGAVVGFAGYLPEDQLRSQLGRAQLFVSCASSDGTSVSLLEAMAAGCVPIVTDLPVNHEWIEPGGNGLLFPVDDDAELARLIAWAASHPEWRADAARRNQEIIRRRALWTENMASVEAAMLDTMALCSTGNRGSR